MVRVPTVRPTSRGGIGQLLRYASAVQSPRLELSEASDGSISQYRECQASSRGSIDTIPNNKGQFKIALCQLSVSLDKERNIARARQSIKDAAEKGARLIVLPEMWNCPFSNDNFPKYAEDFDDKDASPSFSMLSEAASSQGITIVGGSMPERCGDRLYNTSCVFGIDGKLQAKHRKVHLFDIDVPGDTYFKESDTLTAGDKPTIVDTDVGRIGIGICHDICFPELAMLYGGRGAQLICYPGAFNMSTGELLWELVQRARQEYIMTFLGICSDYKGSYRQLSTAGTECLSFLDNFRIIERAADNQLFVATCSPAQDSTGCYMIWGHSTLVGPSGDIIATTGQEETTVFAEIDYSMIQLLRENLPLEKKRRVDIYQLIDVYEQKD
ncbi:hypothetical protein HHK36_014366 [Tetracentron sinense]|uniref:CN hydrolase domain-containing protein n=1 Tax=Tetracentron sinense TaxID=13715 RepID=A0A834Z9L3_TETSI|nr:hypothetical protein HHK36_014366 [Tetracentron sinense]